MVQLYIRVNNSYTDRPSELVLSQAKNLMQLGVDFVKQVLDAPSTTRILRSLRSLRMTGKEDRDCHGCSLVSLGTPRNDGGGRGIASSLGSSQWHLNYKELDFELIPTAFLLTPEILAPELRRHLQPLLQTELLQ